jgi:uncharacterized membrane protein
VAGLRSMTAPALVSRAAASGDLVLRNSRLRVLARSSPAKTFMLLAAGEIIADKAPFIPNRTDAGPLVARMVSGGLCGAALCLAGRQPAMAGAVIGSLAAIGGAFLGYQVRRHAVQEQHLPDLGVALTEDLLAITGGLTAISSLK